MREKERGPDPADAEGPPWAAGAAECTRDPRLAAKGAAVGGADAPASSEEVPVPSAGTGGAGRERHVAPSFVVRWRRGLRGARCSLPEAEGGSSGAAPLARSLARWNLLGLRCCDHGLASGSAKRLAGIDPSGTMPGAELPGESGFLGITRGPDGACGKDFPVEA